MHTFHHVPGDSSSLLGTLLTSLCADSTGRLWAGYENGLQQYDFASGQFREVAALRGIRINHIMAVHKELVWLFTERGLARLHPATARVTFLHLQTTDPAMRTLLSSRMYTGAWKGRQLLIASTQGLLAYDTLQHHIQKIPVPPLEGMAVRSVATDRQGNTWMSTYGQVQLVKQDPAGHCSIYDHYLSTDPTTITNNVNHLFTDPTGQVWAATTVDGLLQYRPGTNDFIRHVYDPLYPGTLLSNTVRSFAVDGSGTIWLGGNNGVSFFHPGRQFFSTLMPFADSLTIRNRREARMASQDHGGQLWFCTVDGIVRYNPDTRQYKVWRNEKNRPPQIYYNSVRGAVTDQQGDTWIATGRGINRYETLTGRMHFIPHEQLPNAFYFGVDKDRSGRIWFCTRDYDGFYWYDPTTRQYQGISQHPQLKAFQRRGGRFVFEDSRGRLWFGFNGAGLGMYHPATGTLRQWNTNMPANRTIAGNTVNDICEDQQGVVWVSTSNGITGIHPSLDSFQTFNQHNGLLSASASAIRADAHNRLWIGTARGLNMLDASRRYFTAFTTAHGLPADAFTDHRGATTTNGTFIFPTLNGYALFQPLQYQEPAHHLPVYLSQIIVNNQPLPHHGEWTTTQPYQFRYDENNLRFELAAPNYLNPTQTWFAYKLEGFDKDWQYTQQNTISYTNVPGGHYQLAFKATANPYHWNGPEQRISIVVATVFYKSPWFIGLVALCITGLLYWLYRYRLQQQQQVLVLEGRTQSLEKEKALVMYENLKQHLNPHFLFNSLTSLSSLIRIDQEMAGDFLDRMSKIYRYILKNRDSETVTLQDELDFVQLFIDLQQTRFEEGLQVHIQVEEEHRLRRIAPVTLQNLVENAIKHNTLSKSKPLVIEIVSTDQYLVVRNNLQLKKFVETSNQTGLHSMRSLYAYLSPLPLEAEAANGYFTVKIPLL
jgi:ligand-binding sensor domain-containing protein